ncbi:MAG: T9SS type A sorting domain-containing protein [Hymenobacter sp.]|nr:MAG: T9SS type A sorting domain-containing protein [Hymenobacter sp.]
MFTPFLLLTRGHRLLTALLVLCGLGAQAQTASTDASVKAIYTYGKLAKPASLPHAVSAAVTNTGLRDITNQTVTLTVTGVNTFASTKTIATLLVGQTVVVTFDAYPTTLNLGTNLLNVSVPTDANNTNNTLTYTQQVTSGRQAQVDQGAGYYIGGSGISSALPGSVIAAKYVVSQPTTLNEARLTFINYSNTINFRVLIYDATGPNGTPGAVLYTSANVPRPVLNQGATATVAVPLPNVPVTGEYYVGVRDMGSANGNGVFVNIAYQVEDPMRANTNFFQLPGATTWSSVANLPFPIKARYAFDMGVGSLPACAAPTALAAATVTATGATLTFTPPTNGSTYSLVYGPLGFDPATAGTTVAVTGTPFTLTGLTQNTRYQIYLRTTCSGTTGQSEFSDPITIQTPPACPAPTALTVGTVTTTSAQLSFTGPPNGTSYSVVYGPAGFSPATAGTTVAAPASPFTLTGLTALTTYDVYVRADCGAVGQSTLVGPVSVRTLCVTPTITALPYKEDFDGTSPGALPCGMTVLNANNDDRAWQLVAGNNLTPAASAPNLMRYVWSSTLAADDWLFTPPIAMQTGYRYNVEFKYAVSNGGSVGERMEVKYGAAPTAAGQTTQLWNNSKIQNIPYTQVTGGTSAGQSTPIVPTANGNYYVGFHIYSVANQFNMMLDDIVVTRTVITAVQSPALDRGLHVYPNPSQGRFELAVRGVTAKGEQRVEVSNALGQVVHTGTYKNETTQELNLSHLGRGLYILKVLNGDDFTTRRLVIE